MSRIHSTFVPPHVIDQLARAGHKGARLSAQQSNISRTKRSNKVRESSVFASISSAGEGPRRVWDCQHTGNQRVALAREESGPATGDDSVDQAHNFLGIVRNYFKDQLNWNSYDNSGSVIDANVNFGVDFMNAFWDGDELTFGDGDGTIFVDFTKSLDVVAHEFSHGVVQSTAFLAYYSQSGALNEHFADVFGSAITQMYAGQDADEADWLIGNEIMGPQLYGEALRSMKAPGTAYDNPLLGQDPQPDHMDNYYSGPRDNRGVHINSGIPNKAFYLVSKDIGTVKAAKIWFQALQNLWSTAQFNDAVNVITEAARVLVKTGEAPQGAPQIVRAAFKKVGLP